MVIEPYAVSLAVKLTLKSIGTIVRKKTRVAGRDYAQVLIYVPKEVASDSAFPFEFPSPCEIEVDTKKREIVLRPISEDEATKRGWATRGRK
jgi:hypothetical protein